MRKRSIMLAVRKTKKGIGNIETVEVKKPKIAQDEVLMKVCAAGICGSDILIEDDKHFYQAPVTLGHEFSGIVVEAGQDVKLLKEGDKIVADIETPTGWLGVTRDGAFSPFMSIPARNCYKLPRDFNMDHAAMTELVVATIHSMQERSTVKAGDFVVIVGPGPMGLIGLQFAKLRGASEVALIGLKKDQKRLDIGKKLGADHVFYSEEKPEEKIMELTQGQGADFVLECAGAKVGDHIVGAQHAIDCAKKSNEGRGGRGTIAFISLWGGPVHIELDQISLAQLDIHGSWSWNGKETWERAVKMVINKQIDLDPLITERYPLEDWKKAFQNLREGKDIKAMFYPNGKNV
jgi:L-iditol 2-dehydrogenase